MSSQRPQEAAHSCTLAEAHYVLGLVARMIEGTGDAALCAAVVEAVSEAKAVRA